jgi:N-acetylglutamate synthase-like GNAT family acetyltransferase
MKIDKISGLDERLYQLIGEYAMNTSFIKRNGNPITTSNKHSWYVGFDTKGKMVCFCSLKRSANNMQIGNLFILLGKKRTFDSLLKSIIKDTAENELTLHAYANNETKEWFSKLGFKMGKKGVNWHSMKYNDCLRSNTKKA